jgi:hypothetical protein
VCPHGRNVSWRPNQVDGGLLPAHPTHPGEPVNLSQAVELLRGLRDTAALEARNEHAAALSMALVRMEVDLPPRPAEVQLAMLTRLGRALTGPEGRHPANPQEEAAFTMHLSGWRTQKALAIVMVRMPDRDACTPMQSWGPTSWYNLEVIRELVACL